MKNKGFTLVEIIAVISIIAILAVIATASVTKYINSSKEAVKESSLKDVQDAALAYGLTMFIQDKCASNTILNKDNYKNYSFPSGCKKTVTVQELINKKYFKDDSNILKKTGEIIIYKYKTNNNTYELKAFAPADILN